jgi:dienelactone hydrolase
MMKYIHFLPISILFVMNSCTGNKPTAAAATPAVSIKEETVSYAADSTTANSFVAYNEADTSKRPVVLIIPEWWGLNTYVKGRAKQLAELGYLAIAVDMYGNGKLAENPQDAGTFAGAFYQNPQLAKSRFDAALAKAKTYAVADTTRIAAIGYCFGGAMALNMARLGEDLKGVVSFHGGLAGVPANKDLLKADVLVCHGEDDKFVKPEEVAQFKKQMDSIGASYTFKSYPGATHAFTNPDATENGKKFSIPIAYNAAADTASFKEMQVFFDKIFK